MDECPAWGEGKSSVQDIKLCDFPKRADDGDFYVFGGMCRHFLDNRVNS